MILLPAIDLLDGRVVRLHQGDYDRVTAYSDRPEEVAHGFEAAGARHLHVVDLDAARGQGHNRDAIRRIRSAFSGTVQVGGGVRSLEEARRLVDLGVDRLILGSLLVLDVEAAREIVLETGAVILAGIDARDGWVKIKGWKEGEGIVDTDLARRVAPLGVRGIVYTNISRDGTLGGPDWERTDRVREAAGLPVILSGGVARMEDLERAARTGGIAGVILGKSLYHGTIDLEAACRSYPQPREVPW